MKMKQPSSQHWSWFSQHMDLPLHPHFRHPACHWLGSAGGHSPRLLVRWSSSRGLVAWTKSSWGWAGGRGHGHSMGRPLLRISKSMWAERCWKPGTTSSSPTTTHLFLKSLVMQLPSSTQREAGTIQDAGDLTTRPSRVPKVLLVLYSDWCQSFVESSNTQMCN